MNQASADTTVARSLVGAACGLIFALGLGLAGMLQPGKVIAFLDVTGDWDPSLAFVMGGAALTFGVCWFFIAKRPAPVLDLRFHLPSLQEIDGRLLVGSALFGLGWGLAGLCPGPAVVSLASGGQGVLIFVGTMVLGMWAFKLWRDRVDSPPAGTHGQEEEEEAQEPATAER